jgi:hypothetical protein
MIVAIVGGFAAGCVAGGYFVFRAMRVAMLREVKKRPWTEEEKKNRARMAAEAALLSAKKGDPAARKRARELWRRLVDDDVKRGQS